jgi:hypothetical protein
MRSPAERGPHFRRACRREPEPPAVRAGIIALTAARCAGVNATKWGARASGAQRTLERRRFALGFASGCMQQAGYTPGGTVNAR